MLEVLQATVSTNTKLSGHAFAIRNSQNYMYISPHSLPIPRAISDTGMSPPTSWIFSSLILYGGSKLYLGVSNLISYLTWVLSFAFCPNTYGSLGWSPGIWQNLSEHMLSLILVNPYEISQFPIGNLLWFRLFYHQFSNTLKRCVLFFLFFSIKYVFIQHFKVFYFYFYFLFIERCSLSKQSAILLEMDISIYPQWKILSVMEFESFAKNVHVLHIELFLFSSHFIGLYFKS